MIQVQVIGASIFAVSLLFLYTASTVYHSFPHSPATRVLRVIDHSAIFVLIAGSYTPFALGPLRGPWGWSLLIAVWTLAIAGIVMKSYRRLSKPWISTSLYIGMGWLSVVGYDLSSRTSERPDVWLLAGGLCYTGGVFFYATDKRIRYGHAVWHMFVLAGSTCHFFAVLWHSGVRTG